MASARSISRLHAPVKTANFADLEIDVSEPSLLDIQRAEWMRPARGFALQGRETRFDAPALMSPIGDTGLPDGSPRLCRRGRARDRDADARDGHAPVRPAGKTRRRRRSRRARSDLNSLHGETERFGGAYCRRVEPRDRPVFLGFAPNGFSA